MKPLPTIRILFLADTHLGIDYPLRPRIQRRRRGDDFFENYHQALSAARTEGADIVVHGGDVFFRSKVSQEIVVKAFSPLIELAEEGIPVYIVPGNHERSRIPVSLFALHENIRIFDKPGTFHLRAGGMTISLSGFPYVRNKIRENFREVVRRIEPAPESRNTDSTGPIDAKILCMHQIVEGARIGVQDYVFRSGGEVVRAADLPSTFDAVLSGHIHRYQILTTALNGSPLPSKVYYPGSIDRTSFAERNELKGYLIIDIQKMPEGQRPHVSHRFVPIPARPMLSFDLAAETLTRGNIRSVLRELIGDQDPHSVVRIRIRGRLNDDIGGQLSASRLREIAPQTMNVTLSLPDQFARSGSNQYSQEARFLLSHERTTFALSKSIQSASNSPLSDVRG